MMDSKVAPEPAGWIRGFEPPRRNASWTLGVCRV